jgi:hypothetical protein
MDTIKTEYKGIIFDSKSEAVFGEEENAMRKTIHLMGMFVLIFSLFISLFPAVSFGEILTIKHIVKQTFGGGQSPDDARISGIALAKREALEKAGTRHELVIVEGAPHTFHLQPKQRDLRPLVLGFLDRYLKATKP